MSRTNLNRLVGLAFGEEGWWNSLRFYCVACWVMLVPMAFYATHSVAKSKGLPNSFYLVGIGPAVARMFAFSPDFSVINLFRILWVTLTLVFCAELVFNHLVHGGKRFFASFGLIVISLFIVRNVGRTIIHEGSSIDGVLGSAVGLAGPSAWSEPDLKTVDYWALPPASWDHDWRDDLPNLRSALPSADAVSLMTRKAGQRYPELVGSYLPFAIDGTAIARHGQTQTVMLGWYRGTPLVGRALYVKSIDLGGCRAAVYYISGKPIWQYQLGTTVDSLFAGFLASDDGFKAVQQSYSWIIVWGKLWLLMWTVRRIVTSLALAREHRFEDEHHPLIGDTMYYFLLGDEGEEFVDMVAGTFNQVYRPGFNENRLRRAYLRTVVGEIPTLLHYLVDRQLWRWRWSRRLVSRR